MINYTFYLSTGYSQCTNREVITVGEMGYTDKSWSALPDEEKERVLADNFEEFLSNMNKGWYINGENE